MKDTPKPAAGTKYYYELDQTYYSVTSSTFIGRTLGLFGLKSIADAAKGAAASGGYPQLTSEFIVKANPAYVFLADTKCCKQTPATVAKRPGWSVLGAVTGGRVDPARRRHRLPVGTAHRRPAAHGRRGDQGAPGSMRR